MLYPIHNHFRSIINLNGLWQFDLDPDNSGVKKGWMQDPPGERIIGVPGSWNDQFTDTHIYFKTAWYSKDLFIPENLRQHSLLLRIADANNHLTAYVNGQKIGEHAFGFLPALLEINSAVKFGANNRIVLKIDSIFERDTLPQWGRGIGHWAGTVMHADYFPYAGLNRDVVLWSVPPVRLHNLKVDTLLSKDHKKGILKIKFWFKGLPDRVSVVLQEKNGRVVMQGQQEIKNNEGLLELSIRNPRLWSPESPYLYKLQVFTLKEGVPQDEYNLPVGLRTISVTRDQVLLNGRPIFLRGFSRHEDFPVIGRGHVDALMVREFSLMKWLGANSFRTSHYPYDERQYQLADELGFLVIDEAPVVSFFWIKSNFYTSKKTFDWNRVYSKKLETLHRQSLNEMMARDWNHPSVIAWSVSNESDGTSRQANGYFKRICEYTRGIDSTRMVVHTNCGDMGDGLHNDISHQHCDMICLNHYDFAYNNEGRNNQPVIEKLERKLRDAKARFRKPIMLTEFGMCGIPGQHSLAPEYFTEEGQLEHVFLYLDVAKKLPFVVGTHLWNLKDFKTQEHSARAYLNFKGAFTRLMEPKLLAHMLKKRWEKSRC